MLIFWYQFLNYILVQENQKIHYVYKLNFNAIIKIIMEYNKEEKNNETNEKSYDDIIKYSKQILYIKETQDEALDAILIICDHNEINEKKKLDLIKNLIKTLKLCENL